MLTLAVNSGSDGWVLLSNMRSPSNSCQVQMFLLDGQQIDLSPDREISICIKLCFPGTSSVETLVYKGDDGHNGAVQCSLTAWSFYLHKSIWEDTFDGDFAQDFRFMKKGSKPPINLFQPRLVQQSQGITFILTSEEVRDRRDERRRKVEGISSLGKGDYSKQNITVSTYQL